MADTTADQTMLDNVNAAINAALGNGWAEFRENHHWVRGLELKDLYQMRKELQARIDDAGGQTIYPIH